MNLIMQTSIFMKWIYYNKIRAVRWFWARNRLIRSDLWAHNSLIRSDFERTIVWTIVWVWSVPWLHNRLDNSVILVWSEVLSVWKGLIRDSLERTWCAHCVLSALYSDQRIPWSGMVWSEVTFVWHGLTRGHFQMAPQPGCLSCFGIWSDPFFTLDFIALKMILLWYIGVLLKWRWKRKQTYLTGQQDFIPIFDLKLPNNC